MNLCPVDQRPVEMVIDIEKLQAEQAATTWYHPDRNDMWRFGGLLPLDIANHDDRQHITTLGEGDDVEFDIEQGDRGPKAVKVGKASSESSE